MAYVYRYCATKLISEEKIFRFYDQQLYHNEAVELCALNQAILAPLHTEIRIGEISEFLEDCVDDEGVLHHRFFQQWHVGLEFNRDSAKGHWFDGTPWNPELHQSFILNDTTPAQSPSGGTKMEGLLPERFTLIPEQSAMFGLTFNFTANTICMQKLDYPWYWFLGSAALCVLCIIVAVFLFSMNKKYKLAKMNKRKMVNQLIMQEWEKFAEIASMSGSGSTNSQKVEEEEQPPETNEPISILHKAKK